MPRSIEKQKSPQRRKPEDDAISNGDLLNGDEYIDMDDDELEQDANDYGDYDDEDDSP